MSIIVISIISSYHSTQNKDHILLCAGNSSSRATSRSLRSRAFSESSLFPKAQPSVTDLPSYLSLFHQTQAMLSQMLHVWLLLLVFFCSAFFFLFFNRESSSRRFQRWLCLAFRHYTHWHPLSLAFYLPGVYHLLGLAILEGGSEQNNLNLHQERNRMRPAGAGLQPSTILYRADDILQRKGGN